MLDIFVVIELSGSVTKFRKQRALPVGFIFFGDEASSSLEAGGGFRLPPPRDFWTPLDSFLGLPELEPPGKMRLSSGSESHEFETSDFLIKLALALFSGI